MGRLLFKMLTFRRTIFRQLWIVPQRGLYQKDTNFAQYNPAQGEKDMKIQALTVKLEAE